MSKLFRFSSIRWRTTAPYILIVLATTLGLTFYLSREVRRARLDDLRAHLLNEAILLADQLQDGPIQITEAETQIWQSQVDRWSELLGQRISLIDAHGLVLAESHADAGEMDNHLNRPEIREARRTGTGTAMRFSETLDAEVMYAAAVILGPNTLTGSPEIIGYVRVALPLGAMQAAVDQLSRTLLISGLLVTVAAAVLATYVSSREGRRVRLDDSSIDEFS